MAQGCRRCWDFLFLEMPGLASRKLAKVAEFWHCEFRSEPKYIFSYFQINEFIPSDRTVKFLDNKDVTRRLEAWTGKDTTINPKLITHYSIM